MHEDTAAAETYLTLMRYNKDGVTVWVGGLRLLDQSRESRWTMEHRLPPRGRRLRIRSRRIRRSRRTISTSGAAATARTFPMNDPDFEALRRLADKEAIRDCVHRFARGVDRHDESILRSVFHGDALDNHGDVVLGRDEFAAWANEWHVEGGGSSHAWHRDSFFRRPRR